MSSGNNEKSNANIALVSGAIIGVAIAYMVFRVQRNRANAHRREYEDYFYDGEDLFI